MNLQSKISRQEIDILPSAHFEGRISLIDTVSGMDRALDFLSGQTVLGFDTESKPSFRKGEKHKVSLLQLSTADHAFLFRLNRIGFPSSLKALLTNPGILKVGVALHDDLSRLNGIKSFHPASFTDLQKMAPAFGIEDKGLRKLAAIILGIRISKSQQLTNWEGDVLTPAQQRYAATDAWVCYAMYHRLLES